MRRSTPSALSLILGVALLLAASSPHQTSLQAASPAEAWIDIGLHPNLVDWHNRAARPEDIARVDHISLVALLDEVTIGRRLVVFKSAALAEELVPRIADKLDIIGYNLEHGPLNPLDEQADPLGSLRRIANLADRYGMQVAVGPDHDFALEVGAQLAPYADIFILQVQRVQTQPDTVREFVVPLAESLRRANPRIQIAVQVRTEGDVAALTALLASLAESIDGISILTSPQTTETAIALHQSLRPPAQPQAAVHQPPATQSQPLPWPALLGRLLLAIVLYLLILAALCLCAVAFIRFHAIRKRPRSK